jgi:dolichol-phosphate mannosyltransferase
MLITIVIPCLNEEGNIPILYQKINEVLLGFSVEFIFVDDNSTDNTLSILERLSLEDKNLKYISLSRNFGHQNALRAGLEFAKGDIVITMDANLRHPPILLPEMLEYWKQGYDVVFTTRKDNNNISFFKRATAKLFYKLINSISDIEIKPGSADFRLMDRKIVELLVKDITEYHLFYRGLINWIGFRQIGIEYTPDLRYSGNSKYSINKMVGFALDGITSTSVKPLRISILLGFLLSICSGIYGIYVIWISLFTDQAVQGWSSILLSILFIGGVNMILLGIISEYLGKLFIQSKQRPYFLIKKSNLHSSP